MNGESVIKYVIDKNLFLKATCIFVSAYSISVIFSKGYQTGWSGLMGISKFLEWLHFDALAKPVADISVFLQQTPWSGGPFSGGVGIIAIVSTICLIFSAMGMGGIKNGGLQVLLFTLWLFTYIDFNVPGFAVFIIIFFALASYRVDGKFSWDSFFTVFVHVILSIMYIPIILVVILSGNIAIQKSK
ncbi:hypothetical protein [Rothia mucilaginosa]|uniref:hypothetical protein n=1 Tax=Rothia mucilaginosa TaxID=43675 RepID=UPI0025CF9263|nr:hypothetical protein [Rothia mucilaginosa]